MSALTPLALTTRIRDAWDGVVHIHDPEGHLLTVCATGFAALKLERLGPEHVPTCLWCVAGKRSELRYWSLEREDNMRRKYIESLHAAVPR